MKTIKTITSLILTLSICSFLWGCSTGTATSTKGNDFDTSKVSRIIKGKTTADEVRALFGDPDGKQAEADGGERWTYAYVTATAKARVGPGYGKTVISNGYKKILNLFVSKEGIVLNYTLVEGPINRSTPTH